MSGITDTSINRLGRGQGGEGLVDLLGVRECLDAGDVAPAQLHALRHGPLQRGPVWQRDMQGEPGDRGGVPRPATDDDVLDLEAQAREVSSETGEEFPQLLLGAAHACQGTVAVVLVAEVGARKRRTNCGSTRVTRS
jgi:hypothetical protein